MLLIPPDPRLKELERERDLARGIARAILHAAEKETGRPLFTGIVLRLYPWLVAKPPEETP